MNPPPNLGKKFRDFRESAGYFLGAQGLHGLHGFWTLAAQGLHGFWTLAAQGLQGLQGFVALAAQGLQGLHGFLAWGAQGLHGLHGFFAAWATLVFSKTGRAISTAVPRPQVKARIAIMCAERSTIRFI